MRPKHRHDLFHRSEVPADQLAGGTPATDDVPIYQADGSVDWGPQSGGGHSTHDAVDVDYDPTASGLTATDVQDAIDEVAAAAGSTLGTLGYAEITANQASVGTGTTDITGLAATVTVGSGRRVRVTVQTEFAIGTAATLVAVNIQEGAALLNRLVSGTAAAGAVGGANVQAILTPSAGSHTYKATITFNANTNNTVRAAADRPAFILVEDIGV